jgi:carbonic anhydrase
VVGHTQCGGVRAAMINKDHGLLEHWLRNIRDVQRLHKDQLDVCVCVCVWVCVWVWVCGCGYVRVRALRFAPLLLDASVCVLAACPQTIKDDEEQWNKLVELNVQEQCINLFANPIVQRKQVRRCVGGLP